MADEVQGWELFAMLSLRGEAEFRAKLADINKLVDDTQKKMSGLGAGGPANFAPLGGGGPTAGIPGNFSNTGRLSPSAASDIFGIPAGSFESTRNVDVREVVRNAVTVTGVPPNPKFLNSAGLVGKGDPERNLQATIGGVAGAGLVGKGDPERNLQATIGGVAGAGLVGKGKPERTFRQSGDWSGFTGSGRVSASRMLPSAKDEEVTIKTFTAGGDLVGKGESEVVGGMKTWTAGGGNVGKGESEKFVGDPTFTMGGDLVAKSKQMAKALGETTEATKKFGLTQMWILRTATGGGAPGMIGGGLGALAGLIPGIGNVSGMALLGNWAGQMAGGTYQRFAGKNAGDVEMGSPGMAYQRQLSERDASAAAGRNYRDTYSAGTALERYRADFHASGGELPGGMMGDAFDRAANKIGRAWIDMWAKIEGKVIQEGAGKGLAPGPMHSKMFSSMGEFHNAAIIQSLMMSAGGVAGAPGLAPSMPPFTNKTARQMHGPAGLFMNIDSPGLSFPGLFNNGTQQGPWAAPPGPGGTRQQSMLMDQLQIYQMGATVMT